MGSGLDAAALAGNGAGGSPIGITNLSGVNAVSGTTFANATAIAAALDVANANAIISRRALGWASTPTVAAALMGRMKIAANSYSPIWEGALDTGVINGHPALSTTNVPASTAVFGDWSQVLILSWGDDAPIEIEVNPFQAFAMGDVGIRAMMSCNIVVRHPQSFAVVSSIT